MIKNKLIEVWHKIWVFAGTYGYVVQLQPSRGLKKEKQDKNLLNED